MVTKIPVTLEPIGSEQATNGQLAAPHTGAGLQVVKGKLPARVACKSMDRQKYLAEAKAAPLTRCSAQQPRTWVEGFKCGQLYRLCLSCTVDCIYDLCSSSQRGE